MKSFLQYISESELEFYLESVPDHSDYQELIKQKLIRSINELVSINARLSKKLDIIDELVKRGYSEKQFSDKTTFKFFNSIEWNLDKFDEALILYKTEDLNKLVEAWSETIINNNERVN